MTPTELRDAIKAEFAICAAASGSPSVDTWAAAGEQEADLIPSAVAPSPERRTGRDRRIAPTLTSLALSIADLAVRIDRKSPSEVVSLAARRIYGVLAPAILDLAWTPPPPTLVRIRIEPDHVTIEPGQGPFPFTVVGEMDDGSTADPPPAVSWEASAGSIGTDGVFTPPATAGPVTLTATTADGMTATESFVVEIPAPPPPPVPPPPSGSGILAARDWSTVTDKTALAGLFGSEGGSAGVVPAIPVSALYDLRAMDVPHQDGSFGPGKAVVYILDPALQTVNYTGGARIATHAVSLAKRGSQPSPSWVGKVESSGEIFWYPAHVITRQFIRFDPWWTTAEYKTLWHCYREGGKHALMTGSNRRCFRCHLENPNAGALVSSAPLPWQQNAESVDKKYTASGFPWPDFYPAHRVPPFPAQAPSGDGDGEWYELGTVHRKDGTAREGTWFFRRVTRNGVWDPEPWPNVTIVAIRNVWTTEGAGINKYEMGVNRNDRPLVLQHVYWGPYMVVDGSTDPNPFGWPFLP